MYYKSFVTYNIQCRLLLKSLGFFITAFNDDVSTHSCFFQGLKNRGLFYWPKQCGENLLSQHEGERERLVRNIFLILTAIIETTLKTI